MEIARDQMNSHMQHMCVEASLRATGLIRVVFEVFAQGFLDFSITATSSTPEGELRLVHTAIPMRVYRTRLIEYGGSATFTE